MAEIINTSNCLPEEYINELLNLPEVISAKGQIDAKQSGSVYFLIDLTPTIKKALNDLFRLDFTAISQIPMRWIKGDTHPHVDNSPRHFEKTHLIYLTDSPGELVIDGVSYPITKGHSYTFSEGLRHETINTGFEPRLLLGPMSEEGIAVGGATTILANGETDTIYFKYFDGTGVQYKINDGEYNGFSLPVTIQNTNTSYTLKVLFENDLILNSDIWYFICGSDNIQFGSKSLNPDGSRSVITIDGVNNYPGLIQNGTSGTNGYNNIYVYNLKVIATNGGTLASSSGWIGHSYFGKGSSNNYVVNCSSTGNISSQGGGVLGAYAGYQSASSLYIIGCSSEGDIGGDGGGIIGAYSGSNNGNIICKNCWSIGTISFDAGGICGSYAGSNSGNIVITCCYGEGNINGGGIYGSNASNNNGTVEAINCYSKGNIAGNSGGIYGSVAGGFDNSVTTAINCYSYGTIDISTTGIYAVGKGFNSIEIHCYSADNSWSDSNANSSLTGTPNPDIGTTWVSTGLNQPYELNNMGYTPYSLTIIDASSNLIQSYSQTILAGGSTVQAIVSDAEYQILAIKQDGSFISVPSITIDYNTGAITATSDTEPGIYILYIRNTGSYNITQFELTVNEGLGPESEETAEEACICSQKPCTQLSYVGVTQSDKITNIHDNRTIATSFIKNNIPDNVRGRQFPSFTDYMRYQQAQLKYY